MFHVTSGELISSAKDVYCIYCQDCHFDYDDSDGGVDPLCVCCIDIRMYGGKCMAEKVGNVYYLWTLHS